MVKLIFKACKNKHVFFIYFFSIYANVNRVLSKKTKKSFQKRLVKGTKIFLNMKKTKSANMYVRNIEIFLKMTKKSVNMVVNYIKIFKRMKNKC